jgi:pathogenesis-related protein 1
MGICINPWRIYVYEESFCFTARQINPMKILILFTVFISLNIIAYAQQVPDNTGSAVTTKDAQQALDFHNKVRQDVGVPPLAWSEELSAFAQAWADHLVKSDCAFEHRRDTGKWSSSYGENIFMGSGIFTVKDASQSWYDEIKSYTYVEVSETNFRATGHYTQMVWRTTTKIGMGVATCSNGNYIIVATTTHQETCLAKNPIDK